MAINPDWKKKIREASNAASPPPWVLDADEDSRGKEIIKVISHGYCDEAPGVCGDHSKHWKLCREDAEFIAVARVAVPALLDALDEAEQELERWRSGSLLVPKRTFNTYEKLHDWPRT